MLSNYITFLMIVWKKIDWKLSVIKRCNSCVYFFFYFMIPFLYNLSFFLRRCNQYKFLFVLLYRFWFFDGLFFVNVFFLSPVLVISEHLQQVLAIVWILLMLLRSKNIKIWGRQPFCTTGPNSNFEIQAGPNLITTQVADPWCRSFHDFMNAD